MKLDFVKAFAVTVAVASLTACHKQVAVAHPPAAPAPTETKVVAKAPAGAQSSPPAMIKEARPAMPSVATKARIQDLLDRIQDVYFDYDKHTLRPEAETALEADAKTLREILAQYPGYKLTVEGYCDERGSDEYNLALGDSRAKQAEEFLERLGLPSSQLTTVSFGKEKPVCTDHNEGCWQKNRRAHITQNQRS